jgi:5-methylcytosine-specific restriction endonuclease McrA
MGLLPRPCAQCGTVVRNSYLCVECKRKREAQRPSRQERGYDYKWQQLSKLARKLQPFCLRCHSPYDLTADHIIPLALGGKSELRNIQVLCRKCNSSKG